MKESILGFGVHLPCLASTHLAICQLCMNLGLGPSVQRRSMQLPEHKGSAGTQASGCRLREAFPKTAQHLWSKQGRRGGSGECPSTDWHRTYNFRAEHAKDKSEPHPRHAVQQRSHHQAETNGQQILCLKRGVRMKQTCTHIWTSRGIS